MLFFSFIMQGTIQQESHRKNIGFRLVFSTLSIIFTGTCIKWFPSFFVLYKMLWTTIDFLKKMFVKNLLSTKLAEFTSEGSTSYLINGKKWFKIIPNILLTEITALLNYSWIIFHYKRICLWLNPIYGSEIIAFNYKMFHCLWRLTCKA